MNSIKSNWFLQNIQAVRNFISLFFIISLAFPATGQSSKKQKPIEIQEQGSFAVGGTVITNPGTFDPLNPTPAGQTFHGDHAYIFYQIPVEARKYPLVMWHGIGQFQKHGKLHRTEGKDIKPYFFAEALGSISLTSQEEEMPVAVL